MRTHIAVPVILMTATLLFSAGCKRADTAAELRDLKRGLLVGDKTRDPRKPQALVYYANNPVATPVYLAERDKILRSFDEASERAEINRPLLATAKEKFARDLDEFTLAVDADVRGILKSICSTQSKSGAGALIITNTLVATNSIKACMPGGEAQPLPGNLVDAFGRLYSRIKANPIYEHSPLSHPEMLRLTMDAVSLIFPGSSFEHSLVIKSHGSQNVTITPKAAYEARIITGEFITRHFKQRPATRVIASARILDKDGLVDELDKDGLNKEGLDKDGLDKDGLDKDGLDKEGLDKSGLAVTADDGSAPNAAGVRAAGITKSEMLSILFDPKYNLFYNVLFLESCKSDLGILLHDLAEMRNPNIGYIFASDGKGLGYSTIDWSKLASSGATSLRLWMVEELNAIATKGK